MKDITLDSKLKSLTPTGLQPAMKRNELKTGDGPSFNDVLKTAIAEVNGLEKEADRQIVELAAGKAENIHEAMIALQKADLSFKTLMEIRDKLIQAYQEVMRLSV